jgi:hypothetical protein
VWPNAFFLDITTPSHNALLIGQKGPVRKAAILLQRVESERLVEPDPILQFDHIVGVGLILPPSGSRI